MLETSYFNNWHYGTSLSSLSPSKINIGFFNPQGIRSMLNHEEKIELKVFRVKCADKTRLMRQLNRENIPDVDEIVRRYGTDKIDFENLNFDYIEVYNDYGSNLTEISKDIVSLLKPHHG